MQRFAILSAILAVTAKGASLSTQERAALTDELKAWKNSQSGQVAVEQGYYHPNLSLMGEEDATPSEDELTRFYNTKLDIETLAKQNPNAKFSLDTPFTMMTNEEFAKFAHGSFLQDKSRRLRADMNESAEKSEISEMSEANAGTIDWTTSGCVTSVKNQGQCGSCWAFSTVAAVESANCLTGAKLVDFSSQQVTSCSTSGGYGCSGGFPSKALDWIAQNGLCTDASYPYTSGSTQQTGTCSTSCQSQHLSISGSVNVASGESSLETALNQQPIVVVVYAGNNVWKQYSGGVVSSCPQGQSDHAVLAVGYGSSTSPFFKIKNSWGTSWGDHGYIYLQRGVGGKGTCNVAEAPTYPRMTGSVSPSTAPTSAPTQAPQPTATRTPQPTTTRTPRPTATKTNSPTSKPRSKCGSCQNCYYAPGLACFSNWSRYDCQSSGFQWCGN